MTLQIDEDACAYLNKSRKHPLTDIERELVTVLCAAFRRRPYNIRGLDKIESWGDGASAQIVDDHLATIDGDGLTRLVLAAHDRCVRVWIKANSSRMLEIQINQRTREGDLGQRHPTIEDAVASWRAST